MKDNEQHDWHDTLIDRGLAELVGGEMPPDLTDRILAAAHSGQAEKVTLAEGTDVMITPIAHSNAKTWITIAVAISLCGVAVGLMLAEVRSARETALREVRSDRETALRTEPQAATQPNATSKGVYSIPGVVGNFVIDEREHIDTGEYFDDSYAGTPKSGLSGDKLQMMVEPHVIAEDYEGQAFSPLQTAPSSGKNPKLGFEFMPARPQARESGRMRDETLHAKERSLPSPYYSSDDVQYYAGSSVERLSEAPQVVRQRFRLGAGPRTEVDQYFEGAHLNRQIARQDVAGKTIVEFESLRSSREDLRELIERRRPQLGEQGTGPDSSGDQYTRINDNSFIKAEGGNAVSTFSIDVDTASYANVRQFLEQSRQLPPPDAVRIEELVNYFDYDYAGPIDETPFAAHMEIAACPWNAEHRLARIGIKGREIDRKVRPQSNLVFLIDVSGSMNEPNKLPLLVEGMKLLTRELGENDKVAIVVYASSEGLALESTRGDQQQTILAALMRLQAGGSTAGGAGIQLAYQTAQDNFIKGGVNRVILCTDGDFNVGVTGTPELERMAEEKAKESGVFLTVLGFGRGNLNDAMMEAISGKGNGNYHYVDNLTEARKLLVEQMVGTLVTIAKDVKIQVEFNPAQVAGYRLIGYENRMLRTEDFNDDKMDAGEIGAGHTVTALYEIVPVGKSVESGAVDPLKYQEEAKPQAGSDKLLTLKLRYKPPDGDTSTKLEFPVTDKGDSFTDATADFQFASAVASFGMLLRNSEYCGDATYDTVLETAGSASSRDHHGYRAEFMDLVRIAKQLQQ
ncbi:vWA domain-containing protein [Bythopirellula polymerisocia]|uniref:von Willebrand factor n=1 Tax=Bythopirellula polymerisocia TaxID=2528003 RepID=A0A5C6CIQ5_9BACT|nr:von Willebrand factor type A domain-containing protein [Bythopirellula polymerisocia]TWU22639.1 von Willebrand factor [Bythopirellula polymerisocia]